MDKKAIQPCQKQAFSAVPINRREAAKRRLLQHRMERLSSDPRMPARLATHPSHMACSMTPPYALLDSAATTPTTALNIDGDGWAPCVDLVALDQPPARQASGGAYNATEFRLKLCRRLWL